MNQNPTDILTLTSEAAALIQRGRLKFANAAAKRLLGEDCLGKTTAALFGPEIAGDQAPSFLAESSIQGQPCILRFSRTENGQLLFLSPSSHVPGVLGSAFLYELRSGLMNVGMSADMLRDWAEETGAEELLTTTRSLTRSYYRLLRLSSNASLALGMQEGALPFSPASLNLSALCGAILDTVEELYPQISFQRDLGRDLALEADAGLLQHLLLNLLSNSLRHAGNPTVIHVSLLDSPSSLVLAVSDNGCGISSEDMATIFERFRWQDEASTLNRGPGLGLSVVRAVAQIHGGTLLMESRLGKGTAVRVSFSKRALSSLKLRSPEEAAPELLRNVLIGLADFLPPSCYGERYMD